jgi:hypothetical protein
MEYEDEANQEELSIKTGEWVIKEATQLIDSYYACKTEHERNRMRGRMEYMRSKLAFEEKELAKLLKQNGYEES